MTRKADLVFVASETLLDRKRALNPRTHVSPHGVDFDHFARAQDDRLPVPTDTAGLPHPVVGFFGLIERWIDLDLIDYLAEQTARVDIRPDRTGGRPRGPVTAEAQHPFLGKRSYADLPAYGKQFDVAIIPYRLTHQVLHANPIKLREYLAMGKPIVSVSTPEIDKYADVVEIAHSREEFLAKLDAVLARPPAPEEIRGRMDRVAGESWDARLQRSARDRSTDTWRDRPGLEPAAEIAETSMHSEECSS